MIRFLRYTRLTQVIRSLTRRLPHAKVLAVENGRLRSVVDDLRRENSLLAEKLAGLALPRDFDPLLYLWRNQDVASARLPASLHFLRYGYREHRKWNGPRPDNRHVQAMHVGLEVEQIFSATEDGMARISMVFLPGDSRVPFDVTLSLSLALNAPVDRSASIVEETFCLHPDECEVTLRFDAMLNSKDVQFLLRVSSSSDNLQGRRFLLSRAEERIRDHRKCTIGPENTGAFGITARVEFDHPIARSVIPPGILYSPVTQCNFNCIHCISRESRGIATRLPPYIKAQLRSWCAQGQIDTIGTDYSGDILWADSRWPGELDFLISLSVPFHIDTNGTHLSRERSERLIGSRLRSINISLDAARDDTHRWIRRGTPGLAPIIENVRAFESLRAKSETPSKPHLSLSLTLMRGNLGELLEFIELGSRLGVDTINCRHLEAYDSSLEEQSLWFDQAAYNTSHSLAMELAAARNIELLMPAPFTGGGGLSYGHRECREPWRSAVILGNGDVQVCCVPKTKIGNLHEESLEEIWNSDRYQLFRTAVNSDNPPAQCKSCPIFRHTGNINSYLPHRVMHDWTEPYSWNDSTLANREKAASASIEAFRSKPEIP